MLHSQQNTFGRMTAAVLVLAMTLSVMLLPVQAEGFDLLSILFGGSVEVQAQDDAAFAQVVLYPNLAELQLGAFGMIKVNENTAPIDLGISIDPAGIAVSSSMLDKAYGIEFASVAENLSTSVLSPKSRSNFALDETTYRLVANTLSMLTNPAQMERVANLLTCYLGLAADGVMQNLDIRSESGAVFFEGELVDTTVYTVSADMNNVCWFVEGLLDVAEQDDELFALMASLYDALAFRTPYGTYYSGKNLKQDMKEFFEEVREYGLDDLNDPISAKLTAHFRDGSLMPLRVDFSMENVGFRTRNLFTASFAMNDSSCVTLRTSGTDRDMILSIRLDWDDSEDLFTAKLSLRDDWDSITICFEWNKENGSFCLYRPLSDGIRDVGLSGTMTCTDETVTIGFDEDQVVPRGRVTLILHSEDSFSIDTYSDLLTITAWDAEMLKTSILGSAAEFMRAVSGQSPEEYYAGLG